MFAFMFSLVLVKFCCRMEVRAAYHTPKSLIVCGSVWKDWFGKEVSCRHINFHQNCSLQFASIVRL